jgi:hypothetical protein
MLVVRHFAWSILLTTSLAAQTVTVVPSQPSCSECHILISRRLTLGSSSNEVYLTPASKIAFDSKGTIIAAPVSIPGAVAAFDANGKPLRTFGRLGSGPGEFDGTFRKLFVGPGDSVHVIEHTHHTVLAPGASSFVRTTRIATAPYYSAISPDGTLIVQNAVWGPNGTAQLIHVLDGDGEIRLSFGGDASKIENADPWTTVRVISLSRQGVWSARVNEYSIELWDLQGHQIQSLRREGNWFSPWSGYDPSEPIRKRPRPQVTQILEDQSGFLWVAVLVADSKWKPIVDAGGGSEVRVGDVDLNEVWDTIIEVLDPRAGRLLGATRLDQQVIGFLSNNPNAIYTRRSNEDGIPLVDIWNINLTGRGRVP